MLIITSERPVPAEIKETFDAYVEKGKASAMEKVRAIQTDISSRNKADRPCYEFDGNKYTLFKFDHREVYDAGIKEYDIRRQLMARIVSYVVGQPEYVELKKTLKAYAMSHTLTNQPYTMILTLHRVKDVVTVTQPSTSPRPHRPFGGGGIGDLTNSK